MEFSKQEYWSGVPLALLQIQAVWRPPGMAGLKGQKEQIIQISNVLTSPPPKKNSKTLMTSSFKMCALEFWMGLSSTKMFIFPIYFREKNCISTGMSSLSPVLWKLLTFYFYIFCSDIADPMLY